MQLRLFRGRRWWPRRSRRAIGQADRSGNARVSHRRTQASDAVGLAVNGVGFDRQAADAAPRDNWSPGAATALGQSLAIPEAGADGTPQASTARPGTRPGTRAGAHRRAAPLPGGAAARVAIRVAPDSAGSERVAGVAGSATAATAIQRPAAAQQALARPAVAPGERAAAGDPEPWFAAARSGRADLGLQDCGCLEQVLIREWEAGTTPAPEAAAAVSRLARLPQLIKEKLAAGLDAIHVGAGGVPDLDHMGGLKGVLLPSGRATWDACAGAYGDRKIIVGSRPSPTPDVMCHEVGHALDDLDGPAGTWQSDSADFAALHGRCMPHLGSEFHRHDGSLGRREFFADAFAAIASGQRPALVEMLSGDTRTALDVMLYFNVRYGI